MAIKLVITDKTIDEVLEGEAAVMPKADQDWYISVSRAFGLPPKGCPVDRYIIARSYAGNLWDMWREKRASLIPSDSGDEVLLRSAAIFEIANYLITLNIENCPNAKRRPKEKGFKDYFLRAPQKRSLQLKSLNNQIKAAQTLLDENQLPLYLAFELRKFLNELKKQEKMILNYQLYVFKGDNFRTIKMGKKGRLHEYAIDALIFNLCEILLRTQGWTLRKSLGIVLKFINDLIDVKNPLAVASLNDDSINERYKMFRKKHGGLLVFEATFKMVSKRLFPDN